ncbi:MAG: hypothetical protein RLZZ15_4591 [Verrucomicrobiota bacterium]|jgi:hypothetical protein
MDTFSSEQVENKVAGPVVAARNAKRVWQAPAISILDADETTTGAVTKCEATGVMACTGKNTMAATSRCTVS